MIESYSAGRDELFAQFLLVLPQAQTLLGYKPFVVYQGLESAEKSPTDKVWMRVSQQTVLESQATISGNDLKRRYTSDGLLFVQLFIPKQAPELYDLALKVAEVVKRQFRGKQTENCIWFRNARIQELPPEAAWFRINVVAEYLYDEMG